MPALKDYDPKQVAIVWDGVELNSGIAEGTFVTLSASVRGSTLNVGGDGGHTRVHNNDHSATVTVVLRKGSATNAALAARVTDERKSNKVTHVGPLTIKDFSGNTLHTLNQAFLDGPPDDEFATDEGNVTWTFLSGEWIPGHAGSLDA